MHRTKPFEHAVLAAPRRLGVRLMARSTPLADSVLGIPVAVVMFGAGWVLQFGLASRPSECGPVPEWRTELDEATAELLG